MTVPALVLFDEPSMRLSPIILQEISEIIAALRRVTQVRFVVAELLTRSDLEDFYLGGVRAQVEVKAA